MSRNLSRIFSAFLLTILIVYPTGDVQAARTYSNGFETQSLSGLTQECTPAFNGPVVETTTKRSGLASMSVSGGGSAQYCAVDSGGGATNTENWYIRFYLYVTTATDALDTIFLVEDITTDLASIRMNTDRTLELWDDVGGAQRGSDSAALSTGTWYRIEFEYDRTNTTIRAYIDGVEFANGSMTAQNNLTVASIGAVSDTTTSLIFDDFAINNGSGSAQTGLPGVGSIVHMQPDSAGDNAPPVGTCADIDEVTPDDGTTKIEIQTTSDIADCNVESSSGAGLSSTDTITLVQVGVRVTRQDTSSTVTHILRIKSQSSGTVVSGTTITIAGGAGTYFPHDDSAFNKVYKLTSYTDPQAGGAWTTTLLDNMQIGVTSDDAAPDLYVSTLWALVEYTSSSVVTPTQRVKIKGGVNIRGGVKFR